MALLLGSFWLHAAPPLGPFMPRAEDFTLMWWANGPQHFLGMVAPAPEPVLCLQSGAIGLAIDTKTLQLLHAGRFPKLKNEAPALSEGKCRRVSLAAGLVGIERAAWKPEVHLQRPRDDGQG